MQCEWVEHEIVSAIEYDVVYKVKDGDSFRGGPAYYIKQGIDQDNIYAFTFTNKAASEMKSRLAKMLNNVPRCNISTFHSYFFQELNMNATTLGFTYS